jgi:hypothetical protein
VWEDRVQRKIFGSKRDEITVDWKGLNNEQLHKIYLSPNIV